MEAHKVESLPPEEKASIRLAVLHNTASRRLGITHETEIDGFNVGMRGVLLKSGPFAGTIRFGWYLNGRRISLDDLYKEMKW